MSIPSLFLTQHHRAQPLFVQSLDGSGGSAEIKKMIDEALCALSGEELSMPVPLVRRILEFRIRENFESFFL
ncbi:hypothetical protein TOC8171_51860 [Pseudomonas syringae]